MTEAFFFVPSDTPAELTIDVMPCSLASNS